MLFHKKNAHPQSFILVFSVKWIILLKKHNEYTRGEIGMISYKKLWHLLIDRDMKKSDLLRSANISTTSMAKLSKNENVTTDVLQKVCNALGCDIADIMEFVPEQKKQQESAAGDTDE